MIAYHRSYAVFIAISALLPVQSYAQTTPSEIKDQKSGLVTFKKKLHGNQSIFAYDYGVPQSPAMLLLGLQAGSVTPASTLKALVAQASSFTGGPGQTIALEMTPAALLGLGDDLGRYGRPADGDERATKRFNKDYLYRLARRFHIGAAAVTGNTGENAVKSGVSLGLTVSLLDSSDPWAVKFDGDRTLVSCIVNQANDVASVFAESLDKQPYLPEDQPQADKIDALLRLFDSIVGDNAGNDAGILITWDLKTSEILPVLKELGIAQPELTTGTIKEKVAKIAAARVAVEAKRSDLAGKYYRNYQKIPKIAVALTEIESCSKRASNKAAYGTDLTIGGGTFWRGKPGELSDLRNGGGAVWAAFRTSVYSEPAEDNSQEPGAAWIIAASTRYGVRETIATGDKTVANIRADTLDGWAGIERRSPDFLASARIGYQQVRANETVGRFFNRQGTRFLLNAQQRMTDQMWLGVSYGNAGGSVDTYNAKRFLVTVSFSPPKPDNITGN